MNGTAELVGAGSARPNAICEVCCSTFYTANVSRIAADRPAGRCDHCGGPLWPIVAEAERDVPHLPVGVRDLETYRRRRRR